VVDAWDKAWEKAAVGAVAVVDCREEIPCNPCEDACRRGAISVGENVCAVPRYDPGLCDGCGRCVALCPGMAIFLLDRSEDNGKVRITLSYEMREEIKEGDEAWAMDGEGRPLGKGKIVKVAKMSKSGVGLLVTLQAPEEWALKVRGVRVRVLSLGEPQQVGGYPQDEECYLCRCEEVGFSYARDLARTGFHALTALRRFSRIGLGYCQGRFCQTMLADEFCAATSREPEDVGAFKVRPPVRPVKLSRLGGEDG